MSRRPIYPSDAAEKVLLRLPEGMREKLAVEAKINNRSMNAEIVMRLEESLSRGTSFAKPDIAKDLTRLVTAIQSATGREVKVTIDLSSSATKSETPSEDQKLEHADPVKRTQSIKSKPKA